MIQETKLGRKCSICTSRDNRAIDNLLSQGDSLVSISSMYDVSVSALSRHANAHLSKQLRAGALFTSAAPPSLLTRLVDLADNARETRLIARQTGTTSVEIRAADSEAKIVLALLSQMGIDDAAIVELIADSNTVVRAVASFVSRHEAGTDLIAEMEKHQFSDLGFIENLNALVH
ncbi:hypothetical protein [Subtercola boreus]|uniref:hypothetical protein n=1 Tax=Subtercola boreus TaxID=120213 RepID=UPI00114F18B4|nr:hypothetical protein [Subtercola boreus]TQL55197.1 hypothetical protein FB464_2755 [Subtercola boreus]